MTVTIFKNFADKTKPHQISLEECLNRIKRGKSKKKIEEIRIKVAAGEPYDQDKKDLPFVVFSAAQVKEVDGSCRLDTSVTEHSGVFILDFDKCDVDQKTQQLLCDPYIYAVWTAPSATGVKALVKCPPSIENHNLYYTAFLDRYPELDATSRNISRGTFESWSPELKINPSSLVWDKKLTEEERRKNKEKTGNRRNLKIIATAVAMVRASFDGTKHSALRDAAILLGGYIATGRVDEQEAIRILEEEIRAKNPKDMTQASKTIRDGITMGKARPLLESKKIEKSQQYLRRDNGDYDFLADPEDMLRYEMAVINGEIAMGLPTGLRGLNPYWLFKRNNMVMFLGTSNTGKSFVLWYLSVLAAKFHGWKIIIQSAENDDGELRRKLKEFYIGKSLKLMDDEELSMAHIFVTEHYRIVSAGEMHTMDEFLIKCELLIDEGFEADVVISDPYNSYTIPPQTDSYRHNIHTLNVMRVFKVNYCSIWFADHVSTGAARTKDKDGYMAAPGPADAEQGVMKQNKVDESIVIHRINHPDRKWELQIHTTKIRSRETGGDLTDKDNPVIIELNHDFCGYRSEGVDPIRNHGKARQY